MEKRRKKGKKEGKIDFSIVVFFYTMYKIILALMWAEKYVTKTSTGEKEKMDK